MKILKIVLALFVLMSLSLRASTGDIGVFNVAFTRALNYGKMEEAHSLLKEEVSFLLKNKGDVNVIVDKVIKSRFLTLAAQVNDLGLMKVLLEHGARVNVEGEVLSPLHIAAAGNRIEMARLLLKYGANPNAADSVGQTALYFASLFKHEEMEKLLMEHGAEVKTPKAIFLASYLGNLEEKMDAESMLLIFSGVFYFLMKFINVDGWIYLLAP